MKQLKSLAKKYLPEQVTVALLKHWSHILNFGVFRYDKKRFVRNYSDGHSRLSYEHIAARLTFHAHSLEKGMSHDKIRYGFGASALKNLARMLHIYNQRNFDKSSSPYVNALSVLNSYIKLHNDAGHDVTYLDGMFGNITKDAVACGSDIGGAMPISEKSKQNNDTKNFKDLFLNRFSVRSYADTPIDQNDLTEAIEIAMKSPSICNRQSSRVHVITDKDMVKKALKIQGGMTGYDIPPALIAITTDTRDFVALKERNQVYVDGGLFAMSLLLALEYKKLASCPLNTMFTIRQDKAARSLLDLEPSENIIMFAAVGNFKKQNNVPKSFRLKGEEITTIVG